jgi:NaMN:DMB phosphoribosyltransferase
MMPAALGLMRGLAGCKVVLAGGTQMAAVLALGKSLEIEGDISIATTKYIVEDKTASFREIVESTGRPYYYADPGLENSKIPGVQIYAQGYVKEGVGMGGASLLAGLYGATQKQLVANRELDDWYEAQDEELTIEKHLSIEDAGRVLSDVY